MICPVCHKKTRLLRNRYIHPECFNITTNLNSILVAEKALVSCYKNFICYDDPVTLLKQLSDQLDLTDTTIKNCLQGYTEEMGLLESREVNALPYLHGSYIEAIKSYYPCVATLCEIEPINRLFACKLFEKCPHGIRCRNPQKALGYIDRLASYFIEQQKFSELQLILYLYKLHGEIDIAHVIWNNRDKSY